MKKDRLYDILETMKKNPLKAVLSHFGALSDHSTTGRPTDERTVFEKSENASKKSIEPPENGKT